MLDSRSPQYADTRICPNCGVSINRCGRREIGKYCSEECAKAYRKKIRDGEIERVCEWCGNSIAARPSATKFCCTECRSKSEQRYRQEHYEKHGDSLRKKGRERIALSRAADPERRKSFDKAYQEQNRDRLNAERRTPEYRAKANERWRAKSKHPQWRLHNRMSSAVFAALKGNKGGRKWESLVGYSLSDLRVHLERQFLPGMSWENMGEWHIDHILPRAMFEYETAECPDFKHCWAITNLRPLWSEDNQAKSAKRTLLI